MIKKKYFKKTPEMKTLLSSKKCYVYSTMLFGSSQFIGYESLRQNGTLASTKATICQALSRLSQFAENVKCRRRRKAISL